MKIVILNKKILLCTTILFVLIFSFALYIYHPFSFAVELTTNSVISDTWKEKFASLMKQE